MLINVLNTIKTDVNHMVLTYLQGVLNIHPAAIAAKDDDTLGTRLLFSIQGNWLHVRGVREKLCNLVCIFESILFTVIRYIPYELLCIFLQN